MTKAENVKQKLGGEWIEYSGDECPVPNGTLVDVILRNGKFGTQCHANRPTYEEDSSGTARAFNWKTEAKAGDIVFYRLNPGVNTYQEA